MSGNGRIYIKGCMIRRAKAEPPRPPKEPAAGWLRPMRASRRAVIERCARKFGVEADAMASPARTRALVLARDEAAWLLHHRHGVSKIHTGRLLNRDHSSIATAIQRQQARIDSDDQWERVGDGDAA